LRLLLLYVLLVQMNATSVAQEGLLDAVKSYYKQNPFQTRFSTFLSNILNDTSLVRDEFYKRTDSGFFYLRGHYKYFNPFHYKAAHVEIVVAESEFIHNDSLQTLDTLIVCQITGVTDSIGKHQLLVKKEFDRFHRKYNHSFWTNQYNLIKKNGAVDGEIYNYFVMLRDISPISIGWERISNLSRSVFSITLRMKVIENLADLP
jgi:hypothetical protein